MCMEKEKERETERDRDGKSKYLSAPLMSVYVPSTPNMRTRTPSQHKKGDTRNHACGQLLLLHSVAHLRHGLRDLGISEDFGTKGKLENQHGIVGFPHSFLTSFEFGEAKRCGVVQYTSIEDPVMHKS